MTCRHAHGKSRRQRVQPIDPVPSGAAPVGTELSKGNGMLRSYAAHEDASHLFRRPMSDEIPTPDLQEVADALRALVNAGARPAEIVKHEALMRLRFPRMALADSHRDQASVPADIVAATLRPMMISLIEAGMSPHEDDPGRNPAAAALYALALERGTQGWSWRGRRKHKAAASLGLADDSLTQRKKGTSPLDLLILEVAELLLTEEAAVYSRRNDATSGSLAAPVPQSLRFDWYAMFTDYYHVWSEITGIANDIEIALAATRAGDEQDSIHYAEDALFYFVRYLVALKGFQDDPDRRGFWVTPTPEHEQALSDAVWSISHEPPFTSREVSLLRVAGRQLHELIEFVSATESDPHLSALSNKWVEWMRTHAWTEDETPDPEANTLFRLYKACKLFEISLDTEWDLLADWYRGTRPPSTVSPTADWKRYKSSDGPPSDQ